MTPASEDPTVTNLEGFLQDRGEKSAISNEKSRKLE
jgi:hypothetical protein